LQSLQFQAAAPAMGLPPSHPPLDTSMAASSASADGGGKPNWTVPTGWKEGSPTQMLIAKFAVADGDAKAEVTVSAFPGDVGGLLANVNRWRRLIGLSPIEDADLPKAVTPVDAQGAKASLVDITGTDPKTGKKARLVCVVIPQATQTWFYKLIGDESVVAREKDALIKFAQSAKEPHGP
jgi:hypothetical protein